MRSLQNPLVQISKYMQHSFHHKKSLGQHFLKSEATALEIVQALKPENDTIPILEIGPGLGILSKHLLQLPNPIFFSELDTRVISFLEDELKIDPSYIIYGDFLKLDLSRYFSGEFLVIGNFPYNISSQILFKILDFKEQVPVLTGMFQKEMAKRVVAKHGNKEYGVITVIVQAYYDCTYLFELPPTAFDPPPKVNSAVIRLSRKATALNCDEKLFKQIVKAGFNQRRKKLSNALSGIPGSKEKLIALNFADKRAEQLSVEDFIELTKSFTTVR